MAEVEAKTENIVDQNDIPEFDDSDEAVSSPPRPAPGLSEEDFVGVTTDRAQDEKDRASLDPPQGDWLKTEKFEFISSFVGGDSRPGDKYPEGRLILKFSGYPDSRVANGVEYKPRFFLNMSPDPRYKDGQPDLARRLYVRAQEVFLADKQRTEKDISELIKFLRYEEYIIRSTKGTDGPYVVGLKSKETLRGRKIT